MTAMTTASDPRPADTRLLAGRTALITGASRGIGARTAVRFAEAGAKVAVNYRHDDEAADEIVRCIADAGGEAIAVRADVRQADAVERMIDVIAREIGPPDTLVLNADPGGFRPAPVTHLDLSAFQVRLDDEIRAAMTPVRAVLPGMLANKGGTILAISSALCRTPVPGFSLLTVSKAALEALVRALAVELGPHGIRVNAIEASMVESPNADDAVSDEQRRALVERIPLRRLARPDDVAGLVTLLASDFAGFVNGAAVPVNGGQVLY